MPRVGSAPGHWHGKPGWTITAMVLSASGGKAWPCADCLPLGGSRRIWSNGPGAWEWWKRPERMEASSRCPGQETDSLPASAVRPTKETDLCPTAGVIPSELEKKNNLTLGLAPRQRKHQPGQNAQQERRPMTKWMKRYQAPLKRLKSAQKSCWSYQNTHFFFPPTKYFSRRTEREANTCDTWIRGMDSQYKKHLKPQFKV